MSWRDEVTPDRTMVPLGELSDGDEIVVEFTDDGTFKDTRHGKALVVGVVMGDFPDDYRDMNDDPLQEGEEYAIMTSSSRLMNALKEFSEELTGERAIITCIEGDTDFDRSYTVTSP